MTTKTQQAATAAQLDEAVQALLGIIRLVADRTLIPEEQWKRHSRRLTEIATQVAAQEPQPFQPKYATDAELAAQSASVADERSGERLRQAVR